MELSGRQIDIECVVNLHKSAYGFKPRGEAFARLLKMSDQDISFYIQELGQESERACAEEADRAQDAMTRLEAHLEGMMNDYSIDRATAVRWEMQGSDCQDVEQWLYSWFISFDDMHNFMEA